MGRYNIKDDPLGWAKHIIIFITIIGIVLFIGIKVLHEVGTILEQDKVDHPEKYLPKERIISEPIVREPACTFESCSARHLTWLGIIFVGFIFILWKWIKPNKI
jgi:hypothetical protein